MALTHEWTEEDKETVRARYTGDRASAERLSMITGHPVSSVKGQIYKLGLGKRIDHRAWTGKEEEKLAELIGQQGIAKTAKLLRRSVNSVAVKLQRMKFSRRVRDGYFTQKETAELLGVDSHWVRDRIARGELEAEPGGR
jgi:hypothetical protein